MSEIKDLNLEKGSKNPVDNAANKAKETLANEFNKKYQEQFKVAQNARKIFKTELFKLQELQKEYEIEKIEFADFIKELK